MLKYGVYSKNGASGTPGESLVASFNTRKESNVNASGRNKSLSHNEKKYNGMKYTVRMYRDLA